MHDNATPERGQGRPHLTAVAPLPVAAATARESIDAVQGLAEACARIIGYLARSN